MPDDQPVSVEAQLAVIRTELGFIKDHITNGHADHETRLRSLEQFKWVLFGVAVSSGGLGAAVSHMI